MNLIHFVKNQTVRASLTLVLLFLSIQIALGAAGFGNLRVFPNPVYISRGQTGILFDGIPNGTRFQIYDISGNLIKEVEATLTGTSFNWDLTNDAGLNVASGIYIYVLTNPQGGKQKGKVGVIR